MAEEINGGEPRRKKSKLEDVDSPNNRTSILTSLAAPISPPGRRKSEVAIKDGELKVPVKVEELNKAAVPSTMHSPFHLTSICNTPATLNIDAVTLKDLLGDPLIAECWEFHYLHELDFLIDAFDSDVRELVKVH